MIYGQHPLGNRWNLVLLGKKLPGPAEIVLEWSEMNIDLRKLIHLYSEMLQNRGQPSEVKAPSLHLDRYNIHQREEQEACYKQSFLLTAGQTENARNQYVRTSL